MQARGSGKRVLGCFIVRRTRSAWLLAGCLAATVRGAVLLVRWRHPGSNSVPTR